MLQKPFKRRFIIIQTLIINHLNVLLNNYGNFYKIFRKSISNAFALASEKNHQYVTLEHLLFSLMDEEDAVNVMKACSVDIGLLRENLEHYIDHELDNIVNSEKLSDPQPTAGFQRVIQRSIVHVQSSGKSEVTGANILVSLFAKEKVMRLTSYKNKKLQDMMW